MSQAPATALFDVDNYIAINEARWKIADKVLKALHQEQVLVQVYKYHLLCQLLHV